MSTLPQKEIDHEMANRNEFGCVGLNTFTIAGMIIITVTVVMRMWSRKIAKIPWKSDDYTLVVGLILTLGAQACSLNSVYNGGFCRHTLTNDAAHYEQIGKTSYSWNILYTVAYPISRISLVLLYRRVFIQSWFRMVCWFLIFCYAGYAIGSAIADFCLVRPLAAQWDVNVKATYHIDSPKLYLANSGFNIATDAILLVLPLVVIWTLNVSRLHKMGLSAIFCLGVLTLIASIMRLICYYQYDKLDPNFGLALVQWWTIAEMDLGILCPCLVTFRPLIRSGYLLFSSHLSPQVRERVERITGVSSAYANETQRPKSEFAGSSTQVNGNSPHPSSLHSKRSQLENGIYPMDDLTPPVPKITTTEHVEDAPRENSGVAVN